MPNYNAETLAAMRESNELAHDPLHNNWEGFRECHIASDGLLVYQVVEDRLVLSLARTGTHSDLRF